MLKKIKLSGLGMEEAIEGYMSNDKELQIKEYAR